MWQKLLANCITSHEELLTLLELPKAMPASSHFPLRVPRGFVARMQKGNPYDPLLLQVLPTPKEQLHLPDEQIDPLQEHEYTPIPGLLHKYHGRALLMITGACAIHCRYCFRQHFPYTDHTLNPARIEAVRQYLHDDPSIREVILSGGDPLAANDQMLAKLIETLAQIPHLQRLRIHTRLLVTLPERVCDALLEWLTSTRLTPIVVTHVNHAQELDDTVKKAMHLLREKGVTLLNQSVLLRGINDTLDSQIALSEALLQHHILPYYLHLLDKVQGTSHFQVPIDEAKSLHHLMKAHLPGFLVPRLVVETPGALSKEWITT